MIGRVISGTPASGQRRRHDQTRSRPPRARSCKGAGGKESDGRRPSFPVLPPQSQRRCHQWSLQRPVSVLWSHDRGAAERRWFKRLGERVALMGCMQTIVGQRKARDFDGQVAELQIRAAILNRFTAPGTPKTRRVGGCYPCERKTRPQPDLCNGAGGNATAGESSLDRNRLILNNCPIAKTEPHRQPAIRLFCTR